jgi:CheY-like chemotaxis protein
MQKLGVVVPSPGVDSETIRKYKAAFWAPLSASKHEALQLLLGSEFDPVAMNLDMVGLDGDEA